MSRPDPFFIIGAPRSGTTYLANALNRHPRLFVTDETRLMTWATRALTDLAETERAAKLHRERWIEHLHREMPGVLHRFYRFLGAGEGVRWGDKNPHYADPRIDPACLHTIDRLFPKSQFIHVIRDGRAVATSLLGKRWASNLDYAIDVWRRHVEHARAFGSQIDDARYMEVRHEDLVASGEDVVKVILRFLGVDVDESLIDFVRAQRSEATAFSEPITPNHLIGTAVWRERLGPHEIEVLEHAMADLLVALGYESDQWARALGRAPAPPLPHREAGDRLVAHVEELMTDEGATAPVLRTALGELRERTRQMNGDAVERGRQVVQLKEALGAERRRAEQLALDLRQERRRRARATAAYDRLRNRLPVRMMLLVYRPFARYKRRRSSR